MKAVGEGEENRSKSRVSDARPTCFGSALDDMCKQTKRQPAFSKRDGVGALSDKPTTARACRENR